MKELSERLRRVRVCCGNWSRICGPSPTVKLGTTGVFLDPPYADEANRTDGLYASDSGSVAHEVRAWALEAARDPRMRVALCGYEGEHDMPGSWESVAWKARGGYGSQGNNQARANSKKETIWFSPHCLRPQENLFRLDLDESTPHRSGDWLRALGTQDELKEELFHGEEATA